MTVQETGLHRPCKRSLKKSYAGMKQVRKGKSDIR